LNYVNEWVKSKNMNSEDQNRILNEHQEAFNVAKNRYTRRQNLIK